MRMCAVACAPDVSTRLASRVMHQRPGADCRSE
ncbi:unnamed protein product, partial [Protopolystoma xenopodis]